jgi:hypothetical protein
VALFVTIEGIDMAVFTRRSAGRFSVGFLMSGRGGAIMKLCLIFMIFMLVGT